MGKYLDTLSLSSCSWQQKFESDIILLFLSSRLELWPGFTTSILQYERNIMLGLDVSFKILRTDTVYDYISNIYAARERGNFMDIATKGLVGEIVLTRWVIQKEGFHAKYFYLEEEQCIFYEVHL